MLRQVYKIDEMLKLRFKLVVSFSEIASVELFFNFIDIAVSRMGTQYLQLLQSFSTQYLCKAINPTTRNNIYAGITTRLTFVAL